MNSSRDLHHMNTNYSLVNGVICLSDTLNQNTNCLLKLTVIQRPDYSFEVFEIRPRWDDPDIKFEIPVAKGNIPT